MIIQCIVKLDWIGFVKYRFGNENRYYVKKLIYINNIYWGYLVG